MSVVAVFVLGYLYEGFGLVRRGMERRFGAEAGNGSCESRSCENGSCENGGAAKKAPGTRSWRQKMLGAALHAVQSFYALSMMIIFMYNNGYLNVALVCGTFTGHLTLAQRGRNAGAGESGGVCH